MIAKLEHHWLRGLATILAAVYIYLGAQVGGVAGLLGIGGGLLIGAALVLRKRSRLLGGILLTAGALPFAALTWWSAIVPALALVTLLIGGVIVVRTPPRRVRQPFADSFQSRRDFVG